MYNQNVDRKQLLKIGVSYGVRATLPFGCSELEDGVVSEFLKFVSDSRLPVNEKRTGKLSDTDYDTLSTLCHYVNQAWQLTTNLDSYIVRLKSDLAFKTNEEPSYLTEYENAIELINLMVSKSDMIEEAWSTLLFSNFDADNFAHTKLGRARNFVFSEIITHQIPLSGGFKSFGLSNYKGYFCGLFTTPGSYKRGVVLGYNRSL